MLPVRIAFDSSLPIVATQSIATSGKTFAPGTPVPWRDIGVDEFTLLSWWRAGMVDCLPVEPPKSPPQVTHRRGRLP